MLEFFAPTGSYTDMAMGTTCDGHDGILRFHRWMLKFAPDSNIDFFAPAVGDGVLLSGVDVEWKLRGRAAAVTGWRPHSIQWPTLRSPGIAACRYDADGKLTSHRDFWDAEQMVAQPRATV